MIIIIHTTNGVFPSSTKKSQNQTEEGRNDDEGGNKLVMDKNEHL